jgi:hypothetical protein
LLFSFLFFEKIPHQPCDDEDRENVGTWNQLKQRQKSNPAEHNKASDNSNHIKHIPYYGHGQNYSHILADVQNYTEYEGKQFNFAKDKISRKRLEFSAPFSQTLLVLQQHKRMLAKRDIKCTIIARVDLQKSLLKKAIAV